MKAAVARTVDLTHAAHADEREDFIGPKAIAGGQAQRLNGFRRPF